MTLLMLPFAYHMSLGGRDNNTLSLLSVLSALRALIKLPASVLRLRSALHSQTFFSQDLLCPVALATRLRSFKHAGPRSRKKRQVGLATRSATEKNSIFSTNMAWPASRSASLRGYEF